MWGPVLGKLFLNQCSTPNADWNVIVFAVSHQPVVQVSSHGDADHLATVFKVSHFIVFPLVLYQQNKFPNLKQEYLTFLVLR